MTAREWLDQVQQRADAATEGPWRSSPHVDLSEPGYEVYRAPVDGATFGTGGWVAWTALADAEFIAAARTDIPRLVAALRAVLDLADSWETGLPGATRQLRAAITDHLTNGEHR